MRLYQTCTNGVCYYRTECGGSGLMSCIIKVTFFEKMKNVNVLLNIQIDKGFHLFANTAIVYIQKNFMTGIYSQ